LLGSLRIFTAFPVLSGSSVYHLYYSSSQRNYFCSVIGDCLCYYWNSQPFIIIYYCDNGRTFMNQHGSSHYCVKTQTHYWTDNASGFGCFMNSFMNSWCWCGRASFIAVALLVPYRCRGWHSACHRTSCTAFSFSCRRGSASQPPFRYSVPAHSALHYGCRTCADQYLNTCGLPDASAYRLCSGPGAADPAATLSTPAQQIFNAHS